MGGEATTNQPVDLRTCSKYATAMMNADSNYTNMGPDYFLFQPQFGSTDFKCEQNKMDVP